MIAFTRALARLARPGDNMTKTLLLAVFGLTALIVNPFFGCEAAEVSYSYDAADMRIAIEGTWKLHVAGKPDVMLTIRQSAKAVQQHATRGTLVRSAAACGSRSLVRNAGACMDISEMPLDVEVAGMTTKKPPTGTFMVPAVYFDIGLLHIELDDLEVSAHITPTGTVEQASVDGTSAMFVRVR
jgi:hypothetical protein